MRVCQLYDACPTNNHQHARVHRELGMAEGGALRGREGSYISILDTDVTQNPIHTFIIE